jgi:hypothetical protein
MRILDSAFDFDADHHSFSKDRDPDLGRDKIQIRDGKKYVSEIRDEHHRLVFRELRNIF